MNNPIEQRGSSEEDPFLRPKACTLISSSMGSSAVCLGERILHHRHIRPCPFSTAFASYDNPRTRSTKERIAGVHMWGYSPAILDAVEINALSAMARADVEQDSLLPIIERYPNIQVRQSILDGTCPLDERLCAFMDMRDLPTIELGRVDFCRLYNDCTHEDLERALDFEVNGAVRAVGGEMFEKLLAPYVKVQSFVREGEDQHITAAILSLKQEIGEMPRGERVIRKIKYLLPFSDENRCFAEEVTEYYRQYIDGDKRVQNFEEMINTTEEHDDVRRTLRDLCLKDGRKIMSICYVMDDDLAKSIAQANQ